MPPYHLPRPVAARAPRSHISLPRVFARAAAAPSRPQVGWAPSRLPAAAARTSHSVGAGLAGSGAAATLRLPTAQGADASRLVPGWQEQLEFSQRMDAKALEVSRGQADLVEERGRAEAWREALASAPAGGQAPFQPGLPEPGVRPTPITTQAGIDAYIKQLAGRQEAQTRHLTWAQEAAKQARAQLDSLVAMWSSLFKSMHQTLMTIIGNLR